MQSLIQHEHLTRQLDIINVDTLRQKVVIIGAGAIGSFLALSLVKMGMTNILVYDHDKVDTVNMSNQFFRFKDIGTPKAEALHNLIKDFAEVEIGYTVDKFDERYKDMLKDAIVISAVDSMEARAMIMELAKEVGVRLIIDPRMSAEKYAQYAYPPENFDKYAKTLYTDGDAVQERCTAKSTIYTVNGAVSLIIKTVKNVLMSETYPKNIQWDVRSCMNPMVMFPNVTTAIETAAVREIESNESEESEVDLGVDVEEENNERSELLA